MYWQQEFDFIKINHQCYCNKKLPTGNPHIGVAVGVVAALIFIACAVVGAVCFLRKNQVIGIKLSGGVSFDKGKGLRRGNAGDTMQIINKDDMPHEIAAGADAVTVAPSQSSSATASSSASSSYWKQETLQTPAPAVAGAAAASSSSSEPGPSLYEELRLGINGVGFKRFK